MTSIKVRAKNFRALNDLDLAIRPLTVVVGPNGAGKTTLLDILRLIGSIHQGWEVFTNAFARYGGYRETLSYFAPEPRMCLGITCTRDGSANPEFAYDVEFHGEGAGCFVAFEKLLTPSFGLERRDTNVQGQPSHGGYVVETIGRREHGSFTVEHGPKLAVIESLPARQELERRFDFGRKVLLFQSSEFRPNARFRSPQQLQVSASEVPSNDGTNLLSVLYTLKSERPGTYDELVEAIQVAVPGFQGLDFRLVGDGGYVNLMWRQRNLTRHFTATQLSDGILRLLWIVTILYSVPEDGLVMFDEPEMSLHPQWIQLVVSLLRQTSARTTVLVATQSSDFIRWLEPSELVIADLGEQGTTFAWADAHRNLDEWLQDFTLSELWTMGELGGRR